MTRSRCVGSERETALLPGWFMWLFDWFSKSIDVEIPYSNQDNTVGTVKITTAQATVANKAWSSVSDMLQLSAALLVIMCGLVYVVVDRALRPTEQILNGLTRLEHGDLSTRLSQYQLRELDRISYGFNSLAEKLEVTTQERSEFARRLVDAQETERTNIARDLHDDVAQQLAAISSLASVLQASLKEDESHLETSAQDLAASARKAMRSLRDTMTSLRAAEIDEVGLTASLEGLVSDHNRKAGGNIKFEFRREDEIGGLGPDAAGHVYRIVQEGLNNASRHSGASRVSVRLRKGREPAGQATLGELIELDIEDNGNGWSPPIAADKDGRLGLIGMRERVSALGGELVIRNSSLGGAALRIQFRLPAGAA